VIERTDSAPEAGWPLTYYNGTILTMEGDTPDYVEAVAVKDGRILLAGTRAAIAAAVGDTRQVDLKGRTMLPGFIDTWGHFTLFAQQTLGVNLAYFSDKPPHPVHPHWTTGQRRHRQTWPHAPDTGQSTRRDRQGS
jgi:predicted amidohydrolase YtcJ